MSPTPSLGVPVTGYAKATALLSGMGDRLSNARAAILEFHGLLRHRIATGVLLNNVTVQLVGLYRETDFVRDRLKTMMARAEIQLIERVINRFCRLIELPPDLAGQHDANLRYAHFLAGVFALARGIKKSAIDHFSKAEDGWGVDARAMTELLMADKLTAAAELLGEPYKRLVKIGMGEAPAHDDRRSVTRAIGVPIIPAATTNSLGPDELKDSSPKEPMPVPTPASSPNTSTLRTKPSWRSLLKRR